jgi:hypothetical protein
VEYRRHRPYVSTTLPKSSKSKFSAAVTHIFA